MEFIIRIGKHTAEFMAVMLLLMWKSSKGFFTVPMSLWGYEKDIYWHRITGRKGLRSSVEIIICCDVIHPGRYLAVARVSEGGSTYSVPIKNIYNDRKYSYSIGLGNGGWEVQVDEKVVNIELRHHPVISFVSFPKLDHKYNTEKEIIIKIEKQ